jgi:pyruvate dehydrogenase E2 component (dihydrolipoamide acetyltransferase)
MPTEIRLAQAGMAMTDGEVTVWHKQAGDRVTKGEVVAEVEAAKTTVEIEAPLTGTLAQIVADVGTVVGVREVLAVMVADGEDLAAGPDPAAARPDLAASGAAPPPVAGERTAGSAAPRQVEPAARRLSRELDVDLAAVAGSGPGGRVVLADIEAYRAAADPAGDYDATPMSSMRRVIAGRMTASLRDSAQLTMMSEVDVTDLVRMRISRRRETGASYVDLLVRACATALHAHPRLNASVQGDEIRTYRRVNIGIAVAVDDGLIVPVLTDVACRSLEDIAASSRDLIDRARAARLEPAELAGATFTVTNLGGYGVDAFTPILDPPQVAILGVGRISERPAHQAEGLDWRKLVTLSLTVDHRAVDGAPGAQFLQTLAATLMQPAALFG